MKDILLETTDFSARMLDDRVNNWIEENHISKGAAMNALRLVIVGSLRGPHIFDIISWIGREETLTRIDRGLGKLSI